MRRILTMLTALMMALSLAACGQKTEADLVNGAMKQFDKLENGVLEVRVATASEEGALPGAEAETTETLTFLRSGKRVDALYRGETVRGGTREATEMKMEDGKIYLLEEGEWKDQGKAGGSFAPFGNSIKSGGATAAVRQVDAGTEYRFTLNEKSLEELNKQMPDGQQALESSAAYTVNGEGLLVAQETYSRVRMDTEAGSGVVATETSTRLTAWNQPDFVLE